MRPALFIVPLCLAALAAGQPAQARQAAPPSGIPAGAAEQSKACAAVVTAQIYLIQEEGVKTSFDVDELNDEADFWSEYAAMKAGVSVDALMDDDSFVGLAEAKTQLSAPDREVQVRWCISNKPSE
jgi:hypothetical protein